MTMPVNLTPDQIAEIHRLASATGRGTDEILREAVENLLAYNDWFRVEVRVGQEQIRQGQLIEDGEVRSDR